MKHLFLLLVCVFSGGCFGGPRLFDGKLSFEDHRQIVNIYGDMYGNIIIQNPDGYDEYRHYLKPRTVFVEKEMDTTEEARRIANDKYNLGRQLSWDCSSFGVSSTADCGSVGVSSTASQTVTKYTPPVKTYSHKVIRTEKPQVYYLGVAKRVH